MSSLPSDGFLGEATTSRYLTPLFSRSNTPRSPSMLVLNSLVMIASATPFLVSAAYVVTDGLERRASDSTLYVTTALEEFEKNATTAHDKRLSVKDCVKTVVVLNACFELGNNIAAIGSSIGGWIYSRSSANDCSVHTGTIDGYDEQREHATDWGLARGAQCQCVFVSTTNTSYMRDVTGSFLSRTPSSHVLGGTRLGLGRQRGEGSEEEQDAGGREREGKEQGGRKGKEGEGEESCAWGCAGVVRSSASRRMTSRSCVSYHHVTSQQTREEGLCVQVLCVSAVFARLYSACTGFHFHLRWRYTATGSNCDTTAQLTTIRGAIDAFLKESVEGQCRNVCLQMTHGGTWIGYLSVSPVGAPPPQGCTTDGFGSRTRCEWASGAIRLDPNLHRQNSLNEAANNSKRH
ncbi:hypothetical protein C8R44DRAFT_749616 [Mycena epipterygia]|nr:hypothetical protein C8R44DRAFT_749616 [Mycena epipterygia]